MINKKIPHRQNSSKKKTEGTIRNEQSRYRTNIRNTIQKGRYTKYKHNTEHNTQK